MNTDERWNFLVRLDEELLKGGVMMSEWSAFLVRNADLAFVYEAHLACLLTAVAAIESHLRTESAEGNRRLFELIDSCDLDEELKAELHAIRRFRNSWVHVDSPWDDSKLLEKPNEPEQQLFEIAQRSLIALRKTVYSNPFV
jgi:hypothetical protein